MNHRRLINSSIFNINTDRGPILTHQFDSYKRSSLIPIYPKLRSGTMNHTRSHADSYEGIIQPKNFTGNVKATKHQATCIRIATIVLQSLPQCNAKEALIHVMPNYDPPSAQHNDHSQTYLNKIKIESYGETTRTQCTRL